MGDVSTGAASRRSTSLAPSLRTSLEESFGYNSANPLQYSLGTQHTPRESSRRYRTSISSQMDGLASEVSYVPEVLNERAVRVIDRVDNKLSGREFGEELTVAQQVQRLIEQATSHQNLCQCFVGWCPFW